MMYYKIDGSNKLEVFAVGNAGIIPKKGEIVNLKEDGEATYTPYDVAEVRYFYEQTPNGTFLLKDIMIQLFSIK